MANRFILTAQLRLAAPTNIASVVNQINRGLRNVHVNVNINTHNINQQLNAINKNLNSTSKNARAAGNDIQRFGEQAALAIRRYGAFTLATTAFIKLTHAIQSGVQDAIKFDREMVRIAQVTGHSLSGLKDLNQEVTRLAKTYGVASSEILEAGVTLAQAGQSAKQVKTILESIAKTGVSATFGDMKNTTEAVIAAMQQFNLKAEDMEETLSSINAVSAKFAVESSDITTAIVRTGGAFQAAGGNIKEFQALFTSVRQTTRESAETIATGFRTIFTRLQRSRTQNFLQSLGIDLKDVEGQFVGPYEAIRRLSTALKDLRSTDPRFAQIIEELGGFRQISKVIPLIEKFDVAQEALNVSLRSGASLTEDAEVAQQSLAIQISKVREEFLALIRNVSNNVAFKGMVDLTLKLTSSLISLANALEPIIPLLTAVAAVKIGSGIGQFTKGFSSKLFHSEGGPIHAFASGGLVPGHGSGDTVPARLTPGEFVIRKDAVKAIGANNLQRANKYANGGFAKGFADGGFSRDENNNYYFNGKKVTKKDIAPPTLFTNNTEQSKFIKGLLSQGSSAPGYADAVARVSAGKKDLLGDAPAQKTLKFGNTVKSAVDLGRVVSIVTPDEKFIGKSTPLQINGTLDQIGKATSSTQEGSKKVLAAFAAAQFGDASPANIAKARATEITANTTAFGLKKGLGESFNRNAVSGVVDVINKVIKDTPEFQTVTNMPPKTLVDLRDVVSKSAQNSVRGILFEGIIRQAIGSKIPSGSDAVIDFNNTSGFGNIFENGSEIGDKAEAKSTLNLKNARSAVLKTLKDRYGIESTPRRKSKDAKSQKTFGFASGGAAQGTDTVPAMLTPGEFVINKKAASRLGSHALNNLNKADKVQHFASGGTVGGTGISTGALLNPITLGLVFSSLQQFGKMMSNGNKDLEGFLDKTTSLAFQFGVFKTILDGAKGAFNGAAHRITGNDSRSLGQIQDQVSESRRPRLDRQLGRIDDVASQYNINPETVNRYKTEVTARHNARVERAANIKYNSLGNRVARGTVIGASAVGAIGSVAGEHISGLGKAKIANGEDGTGLAAAGGALSGAATGASIGAIFGPWGIAIGAAVGGLHGFYTSLKAAEKELEEVKFAKKMEEFTNVLDRYASGKLSLNDAKGKITDGTLDSAHRFLASSGEDRQKAKANFAPNASNVEKFITELAKSSNSFEELEKSTGVLLSDFSLLTNLPYKDLKDQLTKQITAQKKAAEFVKTTDKMKLAEQRATVGLNAMADAVHNVSQSFNAFDNNLASSAKFLDGQGAGSTSKDGSELLANAAHGRISDTGGLDKFTSDITKSFGEMGAEQAKSVSENAKLLNQLPQILLEAKNQTGFGDGEGRFEEAITRILTERKFSQGSIQNVVGGVRQSIGAEGKDEKIIDAIRNDVSQVAGEVGKALQHVIAEFKEFAPVFKAQADRISAAFEVYTNAQLKASDIQQNIIRKDQQFINLVAGTRNQVRGNAAIRSDQLTRVGALTGGTTDAQGIFSILKNAQASSKSLGEQASSTSDVEELTKLKSAQAEQNIIIQKANKALHELADNSETLAEIQKELAEVEDRRKEKNGVLDTAVFGSREEKLQQSKALAVTAHAQRFGIDAVPEQLRGIVKQTLEGRGKEGKEELARLKANSRFGQAIGAQNAKDISTEGDNPAANKLLEAAKEYIKAAQEAEKALQTNALNLGSEVKGAIEVQNKEFLTKLEAIFKQNLIVDKENKIAGLDDERLGLVNKADNAQLLSSQYGINKDNKASAIGAVEGLRKLHGIKAEREALGKSEDFTDTANSMSGEALRHMTATFAQKNGLTLGKQFVNDGVLGGREQDFNERFNAAGSDINKQREVARQAILAAKGDKAATLNTQYGQTYKQIRDNHGDIGKSLLKDMENLPLERMDEDIKGLSESLNILGTEGIDKLRAKIDALTKQIAGVEADKQKIVDSIPGHATGGKISGVGNTDTVHAMLTPGEFVMRKSAVEAIGADNLYAMNNGYAIGGIAGDDFKRRQYANEANQIADEVNLRKRARESASRTLSAQSQKNNLNAAVKRIDFSAQQEQYSKRKSETEKAADAVAKKFGLPSPRKYHDSKKSLDILTALERSRPKKQTKQQANYERMLEARLASVKDKEIDMGKGIGTYIPKSALKDAGLFMSSSSGRYELATRGRLIQSREAEKANKLREKRALRANNGFNSGGHVGGGSVGIQGVDELRGVVEKFSTVVNGLAEKLSQFKDMSISLQATHKVDVTFNGAEVFNKLQPEFQKMAIEESKKAINNMLDSKFPDVGKVK